MKLKATSLMNKPPILTDAQFAEIPLDVTVDYEIFKRRCQRDDTYQKMLEQLVKWGDEPCPHKTHFYYIPGQKKKDCHLCWRELSKESERG